MERHLAASDCPPRRDGPSERIRVTCRQAEVRVCLSGSRPPAQRQLWTGEGCLRMTGRVDLKYRAWYLNDRDVI